MKCTISAFLVLTILWSAYDSKSQSFDSTFHSDGILEANLQGRVLMKADARTGQLDLKNLHPGVYIFKYNHSTHLFSKMD